MEPDVSLDRLENPGACVLLRAGLDAQFLAATGTGAERRAAQHQPHAGRIRRHPRNFDCLSASPGPAAAVHPHLSYPNEPIAATPLLAPQPPAIRPCNPLGHTSYLPINHSPGMACPRNSLITCKLPLAKKSKSYRFMAIIAIMRFACAALM